MRRKNKMLCSGVTRRTQKLSVLSIARKRTRAMATTTITLCLFGFIPLANPFLLPFAHASCALSRSRRDSHRHDRQHQHERNPYEDRVPGHRRTSHGTTATGQVTVTLCSEHLAEGITAASPPEEATAYIICDQSSALQLEQLEKLSRSDLEGLCKLLKIPAVGKTSELISRLFEARGQAGSMPTRDDVCDQHKVVQLAGSELESLLLTAAEGPSSETASANGPDLSTLDEVRPNFDCLSDGQWEKVRQLGMLLTEWNSMVNLISRKDIGNVMRNHVVPCLAMAKALDFEDGVEVLDVGTGGGLPGLPLAICFPNVQFTLIDGKGKKIFAVQDMANRLRLNNVRAFHIRAEDVHETFDFVIGRAVTSLPKFVGFVEKNLRRTRLNKPSSTTSEGTDDACGGRHQSRTLRNGVLYMRGDVSQEELSQLGAQPTTVICLESVLQVKHDFKDDPEAGGVDAELAAAGSGQVVDVGDDAGVGNGSSSKGYSSVFHFTSENIWNRMPVVTTTPNPIAGAAVPASLQGDAERIDS